MSNTWLFGQYVLLLYLAYTVMVGRKISSAFPQLVLVRIDVIIKPLVMALNSQYLMNPECSIVRLSGYIVTKCACPYFTALQVQVRGGYNMCYKYSSLIMHPSEAWIRTTSCLPNIGPSLNTPKTSIYK